MRTIKTNKIKLLFTILLFVSMIVSSQTEQYEDLLEHRSGFGRDVTGGAGGELIILNSLDYETFKQAVTSSEPRWIRFTPGLTGDIVIKDNNLNIGSNTTIDGRGANITLTTNGACKEINFWNNRENLIIHNITITRVGDHDNCGQGFGAAFGSKRIWVDHVSFTENGDESTSTGIGTSDFTISWCKFYNTPKGSLLSWGPDYPSDSITRVTIHHSAYINGVSRCPKIRRGKVHFYNNVVEDWGWSASEVNTFGQLLSEYNIYDSHNDGNTIAIRNLPDKWDPIIGYVCARENSLRGGAHYEGENFDCNLVFEASDYYSYETDSISETMRQVILDYSGWSENPGWPRCDTMVLARFKLTTEVSGSGTISFEDKEYTYGETATLIAEPDSGWVFTGWSGDISDNHLTTYTVMNANKHAIANFSNDVFRLTSTTEGNGRVSVASNGIYLRDSEVAVIAFPDWGDSFLYWRGGVADSLATNTTVKMDADKNLTAVFTGATGVAKNLANLSAKYNLKNYPNPFSNLTYVSYTLRETTHIQLVIYNVAGEKIAVLVDDKQRSGDYRYSIDGSNLSPGIYYYTFFTDSDSITNKILLIK